MRNKIGWLAIRIILVCLFGWNTAALGVQAVAGDNAPLGGRDGVLNIADLLVMERFILGLATPTEEEFKVANVAPLGAPDNELNLGDLLVLERAVLGLVTLPPISLGPDAPVLNPITAPTNTTNLNPFAISGTAVANSIVHIYVNGAEQIPVLANVSGLFSSSIALQDGVNNVYAIAELDSDFSPASNTLDINYVNNIPRTQGGVISQNTVWSPGIPAQPYLITSTDLTIDSGVQLVIQQGTELRFSSGRKLIVNGSLVVNSTPTGVVFTSNNMSPGQGDWYGIIINATATNVMIDKALIEYASNAVVIYSNDVVIKNCTIRNASNIGISVNNASPQIIDNTVTNNVDGLYLYGQSNPSVTGNKFTSNGHYGVRMEGATIAGQYPQPLINGNQIHDNSWGDVTTTNFVDSALVPVVNMTGNWWGNTDVNSIAAEIYDYTDSKTGHPFVDFSDFLNAAYGTPVPGNYLYGVFSSDATLSGNNTYQVLGDLIVPSGVTLTIQAGAKLQFSSAARLTVDGSLQVLGSIELPVLFTSNYAAPAAGSWRGLVISSGATSVLIDHADIAYAFTGIDIYTSNAVVQNSLTRNSNNYGINITNASPQLIGNTIKNNVSGLRIVGASNPLVSNNMITANTGTGIVINCEPCYASGTSSIYPVPVIHGNRIYGNSPFNVQTNYGYYGVVPVADMTGNWWGTSSADAISASISDYADARAGQPVVDFSGYFLDENGIDIDDRQFLMAILPMEDVAISAGNYLVVSDILIPAGIMLTINPGVNIHFITGAGIIMHGSLSINGQADNMVYLTSAAQGNTPASFEWDGIYVYSDAGVVDVNYANIQFANNGIYFDNATGSVRNSVLTNNNIALYINGNSHSLIDSNTIVGNKNGIYLFGTVTDPLPIIYNNDIYGNGTQSLYLRNVANTTVLDMGNNWWGSTDPVAIHASMYSTGGIANLEASVPLANIATTYHLAPVPYGSVVDQAYITPSVTPGIKDSVQMTAAMNQVADWSVDVRSIDPVSLTAKHFSGNGALINIVWDGRDDFGQYVEDDKYLFIFTRNGEDINVLGMVTVDNTAPQAILSGSLNNAILSASPLSIEGMAYDINKGNYLLEVADGWPPGESAYRQLILSNNNVNNAVLFSWPFGDLGNALVEAAGKKTLKLTVTDAAGNVSVTSTQLTLNHQSITNVTRDVFSITPTLHENVTVSFDLASPATVYLRFYPEMETNSVNPVAEVSETFTTSGRKAMTWNGMGPGNTYLPDEAYRYELHAISGVDQVIYKSLVKTPWSTSAGGGIDLNMNIYINDFYKVTYAIGSGDAMYPMRIGFNLNGEFVLNKLLDVPGLHDFYWDGRDSNNKLYDYPMALAAGDGVAFPLCKDSVIVKGNSPVITGTEDAPNVEVMSTPYIVLHSYDQVSQVVYRLSQDSRVTVRLLKPCFKSDATCSINHDDPNAITLVDDELQMASSAGEPVDHVFEWRGYDFNATLIDSNNILVTEDGVYTFSIKATSVATGVSTIYRGVLQLYH